jgi:hypothetical protein
MTGKLVFVEPVIGNSEFVRGVGEVGKSMGGEIVHTKYDAHLILLHVKRSDK